MLPAAPHLGQLLAVAPRLKLLVTSRAALELTGEHRFTVLPLLAPPPADVRQRALSALEAQARYPAVALFVQRAQAVSPGFVLTNTTAPLVAEICRRLDGLPLAIELAAARVGLLSPAELLVQLENRFAVLTSRARDLPERHLSLRQALGWSYDLLAPAEQRLLRRLSVFVGACSLEAAATVCGGGPGDQQVFEGISALLTSSLLQRREGEDGRTRFGMLETVYAFAHEQLAASGEAELLSERHAAYYLALGSPAWEAWLADPANSSFSYRAERGAITVRRERKGGGWYWYAYRASRGRLRKAYLGAVASVTPERLREAALSLTAAPGGPDIRIGLLGPPSLRRDGQAVAAPAKAHALLAYLGMHAAPQLRERLLDLLWPESAPETARKNLRNLLWRLRRDLQPDLIQGEERLKQLTHRCAPDLLPWLGMPDAIVVEVTTPEYQATARRLDNLLTLQAPDGALSLHLVEWQGYRDEKLLWRVLEYLGMLGQSQDLRPLRVSIIYLNPGDDVGDTLDQAAQTVGGWTIQFHTVRLWEHTAQEALASGRPGLLALLPLLAGATAALVLQSAQHIVRTVDPPDQANLLLVLGSLADRLLPLDQLLRLVTKERLMNTDLITYLTQEKDRAFAEREAALLQEKATLEERLAAQAQATLEERLAAEAAQRAALLAAEQAARRTSLQQAVEDAISARFPDAPLSLTRRIRAVADPARLQALIPAVITAPDLAAVEALLG